MAKTKTPFYSFGSRGTVGRVLTSQKRGGDTILRTTPVPTDPYSLNQAYQRWDYRDYAYQWTLLSNAEKQVYRTTGSRYHITGFSQFMREQLKTLPDLAGRWRLDEKSGVLVADSSKNTNTGTIFGASFASGAIAGALSFDGLNDQVQITSSPSLLTLTSLTIELFINTPLVISDYVGFGRTLGNYSWWLFGHTGNVLGIGLSPDGTAASFYFSLGAIPVSTYVHIAVVWDGSIPSVSHYIGGLLDRTQATAETSIYPTAELLSFGASQVKADFPGIQDQIVLYNRALDATEIKRHSERRYPA